MTREEIQAMEPGRELDKLIFKFVMGGRIPEPPFIARIMNFSSDISAAWEVVKEMRLIVAPNNNGGWKAGRMDGARLDSHHVIWSNRWSFAETAPEAICKAALLAILPGEE